MPTKWSDQALTNSSLRPGPPVLAISVDCLWRLAERTSHRWFCGWEQGGGWRSNAKFVVDCCCFSRRGSGCPNYRWGRRHSLYQMIREVVSPVACATTSVAKNRPWRKSLWPGLATNRRLRNAARAPIARRFTRNIGQVPHLYSPSCRLT